MALTTKEQVFFRDIPLTFRINPVSNDISLAKNEEAIKKALINLLGTKIGTRPFRPDFGVDIEKYLFEVADYQTEVDINKEIGRAIQEYEPRVRLITIDSTIQENNGVKIVITYTVAGFPRVQTLETTVTTRVK
jgi:phage baseplate assembly protein W